MTEADYCGKLLELDRLLNDPAVEMQASRVWSILDEVSAYAQSQHPESAAASAN